MEEETREGKGKERRRRMNWTVGEYRVEEERIAWTCVNGLMGWTWSLEYMI